MNDKSATDSQSIDHETKCVLRTGEAIYGTFITETFDDVFLIKSLDFIIIELERSFGIQVTSGDDHCTFSTCSPTKMIRSERATKFAAGVTFRVLRAQEGSEAQCHEQLANAVDHLEMILSAIEKYAGGEISNVGKRINSAINILSKRLAAADQPRPTSLDKYTENIDLLNSFINRLDRVTLALGDVCYFPKQIVGGKRCLRLFFFHQLTPGKKTQMRLHPLANQLSSKAGEYLPEAQKDDWNFNEVASRGLVSWIHLAGDRPENRDRAFAKYLEHLTESRQNDAINPHAGLAIPMHIDGNAWLVVLFVFAATETNHLELAHYLLRTTVPVLFEKIASLVRDEYLNLIRDNARQSLRRGSFDVNDLNARLRGLAQIFPYNKEWYLSRERNGYGVTAFGETNFLHKKSVVPVDELPELEFRTIGQEVVREKLQDTAREVHDELQKETQHGADEGIGHALKNIVELTNWQQALPQIRSVIRNYDRLIAKGRHPEILAKLQTARRSLESFSLVAGLGHFSRLTGPIGRDDYGKFVQWHDAATLQRWNSKELEDLRYVCDAFVSTVCHIVAPLCSSMSAGLEPHLFQVRCVYARQSIVSSSDYEESESRQFDRHALHVPPFKKGSDAAYSFVFALTEPLVNALRVLEQLRGNPNFSHAERVLRIDIKPQLPDQVVFSIVNASAVTVQKTLSGFTTTRRMLQRVGIADLTTPKAREIRSGVYEVVTEVQFRPYDLAKKIAQEIEE
jgi:hypothetical protein